jgi:hypothetical protein
MNIYHIDFYGWYGAEPDRSLRVLANSFMEAFDRGDILKDDYKERIVVDSRPIRRL